MWATGAMPPGIGTGSVARVDAAATRLVVSNAAEGAALRRCSANSFRMSNLVCAWLDAADRTSIAQKQASRIVMRAAARHPRRCGDGSIACMCIATPCLFWCYPRLGPQTNRQCLEAALYARELSILPCIVLLGEIPVNRNLRAGGPL